MPAAGELPQLVEDARRGDQAAWDEIVRRYSPLVWGIARGHGLPTAAASAVAQTTWLRLVESLDDAPPDAIGEWAADIARAESAQALRWVDPRPDRSGGPTDPVWDAVARMPARCRLVLRLLAVTPPPTSEELAAALDVAPDAAEESAQICLQRLAEALPDNAPAEEQS